jgi:predicted GNAT family N-acyltransferase/RimJ/RimL family protein N-acetyltransferase
MPLDVRLATEADLPAAYAVRHQVFVVEQDVPPELERDEFDATAVHVVAYRDGTLVGTGRMRIEDGIGIVGRMAVLAEGRGQGTGAVMLRVLEDAGTDAGLAAVELHAQVHAEGFYARAGYRRVGDVYDEAGIDHVTMRKPLPVVRGVRDADSAALIALIDACFAEYPGCVLEVDAEEPWLRAPATAYAAADGRMWVVELDGAVVACVGVKYLGKPTVELKNLYVSAAARRRGLGERLTRLVEAEARRYGADRVDLWSDSRFADAHRLYLRLGYAQLPETRDLYDLSNTTEYSFTKVLP